MIIKIAAFTTKGWQVADAIQEVFPEHIFERRAGETLSAWVQDGFAKGAPLIFIGATGIAVRAIAPFVADKLTDSPVLVLDEQGQFVIPLLAGHIGGANRLAREIEGRLILAQHYMPQSVLTTATDVEHRLSVDVFAYENGLQILNRSGIQKVSTKVLEQGEITFTLEDGLTLEQDMPEEVKWSKPPKGTDSRKTDVLIIGADSHWMEDGTIRYHGERQRVEAQLVLQAKPYILGVGCKKGTSAEKLQAFIESQVDLSQVAAVASLDLKEKEYGLVLYCQKAGLPFITYDKDTLAQIPGEFSQSSFVQKITGVSNVCERAAMARAGATGQIIQPKIAQDGMTLAIVKREVYLQWQS